MQSELDCGSLIGYAVILMKTTSQRGAIIVHFARFCVYKAGLCKNKGFTRGMIFVA